MLTRKPCCHFWRRGKNEDALNKLVSKVTTTWAREASKLLDGDVNAHNFKDLATTSKQDVEWICEDAAERLRELSRLTKYGSDRASTQEMLEGAFFTMEGPFASKIEKQLSICLFDAPRQTKERI